MIWFISLSLWPPFCQNTIKFLFSFWIRWWSEVSGKISPSGVQDTPGPGVGIASPSCEKRLQGDSRWLKCADQLTPSSVGFRLCPLLAAFGAKVHTGGWVSRLPLPAFLVCLHSTEAKPGGLRISWVQEQGTVKRNAWQEVSAAPSLYWLSLKGVGPGMGLCTLRKEAWDSKHLLSRDPRNPGEKGRGKGLGQSSGEVRSKGGRWRKGSPEAAATTPSLAHSRAGGHTGPEV